MDEDGFLMLSSPSVPTTELIVCWASETAMDPEVATRRHLDRGRRCRFSTRRCGRPRPADRPPLTDEPWGIRRFLVREPSGTIVNADSRTADLG